MREAGADVRCLDLSRQPLDEEVVRTARLVAFHLPMHTATRLAVAAARRVRAIHPRAHLCFYGLYAPLNEGLLRRLGAGTILGGEFEEGLLSLWKRLARTAPREEKSAGTGPPAEATGVEESTQTEPVVSLARLRFRVPWREDLPPLDAYARLQIAPGQTRRVGATEASRGCKHRCRHCPIVPVYDGRFRIVPPEVVLADVRAQVEHGAEHVTFGDPDFLNGPRHALRVVRDLHDAFPMLTYDVTIKVEHLLRHCDLLPELRRTGCLFVTSAVESVDDGILARLDKGHTRADIHAVARACRQAGLLLHPTFIPFTPWTTPDGFRDLLAVIEELDWVEQVAPVQLAIRLLVTSGSRLLELPEVRALVGRFDEEALVHRWAHPDPRVDELQRRVEETVRAEARRRSGRRAAFASVREIAGEGTEFAGSNAPAATDDRPPRREPRKARAAIPFLTEPWYC